MALYNSIMKPKSERVERTKVLEMTLYAITDHQFGIGAWNNVKRICMALKLKISPFIIYFSVYMSWHFNLRRSVKEAVNAS